MWQGKHKAITLSFDDGVTQDIEFIKIINAYGLKSTFNLNSQLLGNKGQFRHGDKPFDHNKVSPERVAEIYRGHEVAVHTLTHPRLPDCADEEVIRQVAEDKLALERLVGYDIVGMAYPCGGVNNDDRVAKLIKENTGIKYARTITPTFNFEPQENLLRFNPSVHFIDVKNVYELAHKFLEIETDRDQIFYIWGHSYELDFADMSWKEFEKLCKLLSGHDDVFYGTNAQVLLNK